jgi:cytochrome c-type biogenesis protein CcmH
MIGRLTGSRLALTLLLGLSLVFGMGATDPGSRFNDLGHRLMCTCGCSQVLLECNHVGCSASTAMRGELSDAIASGATDNAILQGFVAKYGATVLAAPTSRGFSKVAWIMPFAVLLVSILGALLLLRRWKLKVAPAVASGNSAATDTDASTDPIRERIRRETDYTGDL